MVYGVVDTPKADPLSRVNTFVHVNHTPERPRYGILLCINGTGIMNSWMRRNVTQQTMDYAAMNRLAASVPAGSEGLLVVPFGNGAERVLGNRYTGAGIVNIDLNRHTTAHILRATQEGIAYSFRYGIDIMARIGALARRHPRRAGQPVSLAAVPADAGHAHRGPHRAVQHRRGAGRGTRRGAGSPDFTRRAKRHSPRSGGWRSWSP